MIKLLHHMRSIDRRKSIYSVQKAHIQSMTVVDLLEVGKKQRRADTLYVSDQGTILDAMKRMAENEVHIDADIHIYL